MVESVFHKVLYLRAIMSLNHVLGMIHKLIYLIDIYVQEKNIVHIGAGVTCDFWYSLYSFSLAFHNPDDVCTM
ncbi:rCG59041, isoform CRA_a, partial [Rattus norvegicus]